MLIYSVEFANKFGSTFLILVKKVGIFFKIYAKDMQSGKESAACQNLLVHSVSCEMKNTRDYFTSKQQDFICLSVSWEILLPEVPQFIRLTGANQCTKLQRNAGILNLGQRELL